MLVLLAARSLLILTAVGALTVEVLSLERTFPRSIVLLLILRAGLVCLTSPTLNVGVPDIPDIPFTAKSLVTAGLARRALVQLSYAIGVAEPLSIYVDTYGTGKKTDEELVQIIRKNWDLRPGIIGEFHVYFCGFKLTPCPSTRA